MKKIGAVLAFWLALMANAFAASPVIEVADWSVKARYEKYNEAYEFKIRVKNVSKKKVNLAGVNLFFVDKLGKRILGVPLPRELYLEPGKEKLISAEYPFIDGDTNAKRIETVSHSDINVDVDLYEILFADGTVWKP